MNPATLENLLEYGVKGTGMSDDDRPITGELNRGINEAIPDVYRDLKRLAAAALKGERANHTLTPTELTHNLYLRLLALRDASWEHRGHFFDFVKLSLRNLLIDYARKRKRVKHGGGWERAYPELDQLPDDKLSISDPDLQAILASIEKDAQLSMIIELKLAGCTEEEIANAVGISTATVSRRWRFAKRLLATAVEKQ
jgi:RNA polymerase sigma factor (TIGR02999 family)